MLQVSRVLPVIKDFVGRQDQLVSVVSRESQAHRDHGERMGSEGQLVSQVTLDPQVNLVALDLKDHGERPVLLVSLDHLDPKVKEDHPVRVDKWDRGAFQDLRDLLGKREK